MAFKRLSMRKIHRVGVDPRERTLHGAPAIIALRGVELPVGTLALALRDHDARERPRPRGVDPRDADPTSATQP